MFSIAMGVLIPAISFAGMSSQGCSSCSGCTSALASGDAHLVGHIYDYATSGKECIKITQNGVTFNGNGFTMGGNNTSGRIGIRVLGNDVNIENVRVRNFGLASTPTKMDINNVQVLLYNSAYSDVIGVTTHGGRNGIVIYGSGSHHNVIDDCVAYYASWVGIGAWAGSYDNTIKNSWAQSNRYGMNACGDDSHNNTLTNNKMFYNKHWNTCFCSHGYNNEILHSEMRDRYWDPDPNQTRRDIQNSVGNGASGDYNTCNPSKVGVWRDIHRTMSGPGCVTNNYYAPR